MKRWYAIHTQARNEQTAFRNLLRQGYAAFLPEYRKRRRHARRVDVVRAPLFPRYLFVEVDLDEQPWRAIFSTTGVSSVVCQGDKPAPIPLGVVEEIRARSDKDGIVTLKPQVPFKLGEKVQIVAGAFADQLGLFDAVTDDGRVILLLEMLGRRLKVGVALADLAAA